MKIKAFLFAALLFAGSAAFAQEATSEEEASKGPFITNSFGSNWFLGAGLGANLCVDGPFSKPNIGAGFALDINGGKWIDPMWGIRAGVLGLTNKHINDTYNFVYVHGDVMWNITNQFWGYKKDRVYQAIPYLTAGLYWPFSASKNFTAGAGLLNKVRLTDRLDLDIDLMGLFLKQASVDPTCHSSSGIAGVAAATVGVSYKFGTADWATKESVVAPLAVAAAEAAAAAAAATAAQEEAAQQAADNAEELEALKKENAALKEDLANEEDLVAKMVKGPHYVYFEIGKAKFSPKERAHFDHVVNTLVKNGKGVKFTVTGNADPATGSKARNKQLAKMRADYVIKLLTEEYGLDCAQFEVKYNGGLHVTDSYELDRAAIIEAKAE